MATTTIVIKIKDEFFLQKFIFNPNQTLNPILSRITLGSSFFNSINIGTIYGLYSVIDRATSVQVFDDLITYLNKLPNQPKLKSLFAIISSTLVVNLMRNAKQRTSYIGENLLNFYYMDVDISNPPALMKIIEELKALPGVDYVYIRGELSSMDKKRDLKEGGKGEFINDKSQISITNDLELKNVLNILPLQEKDSTNGSKSVVPINQKIESLFNYCGLKAQDSVNPEITVVDFEQGWKFVQNDSAYPSSSFSPILGGGLNYNSSKHRVHGQKTLNILFGKRTSANQIDGLCKGAKAKIASTWFNNGFYGNQPEPAMVKTLNNSGVKIGDIVLLEVQLDRWQMSNLPVEIESAFYAVLKAGVQAGYIIIEAAGNGAKLLDTLSPTHSSQTTSTMTTENPPVDLSQNIYGTGSIMVGGRDNNYLINSLDLNHGNRVDCSCYAESVKTSSDTFALPVDFNATSLASAITAALAAHFQSEAIKTPAQGGIGRRLTITEIKRLLGSIPYPQSSQAINFQSFLSANNITSLSTISQSTP